MIGGAYEGACLCVDGLIGGVMACMACGREYGEHGAQEADMAKEVRVGGVVAYVPTPLRTMGEICEALGVGAKTVKRWADCGAPITLEREGTRQRYSAELARLLLWREDFSRRAA